jgi:phosphopantothenoylcysteine decarboxylase/phosphopantothenate--cysteine ligase
MRFLISGGPTHEYLDDVRFLGNPSTGAMGIAVAVAARDRGHNVTLVLGPSPLPDPEGVLVRRVESAEEMRDALVSAFPGADAVVMTAAVSDYRPRVRVSGKIKKGVEKVVLDLVRNPDILWELGRMRTGQVLVGFALEAASPRESLDLARGKLIEKNLDAIVLNRKGSFGGPGMEDVTILLRSGEMKTHGTPGKDELARWIVDWCEARGGEGGRGDDGSGESARRGGTQA